MKSRLLLIIYILSLSGCINNEKTIEKILKSHIGKHIIIENTDSVYNYNTGIACTYKNIIETFKFISIVYIDQNCDICRTTTIEWINKIDILNDISNDKYAVLFIYRGDDAHKYLQMNLGNASCFPFYILCDPQYKFLKNNYKLSLDVLNSSLLINNRNRICLIGEPFRNEQIKNLYYNTINK